MTMLYFSYGSNMSSPRLRGRVASAQARGIARLHGHEFKVHKASKDGSAKCDAAYTGDDNHFVMGVVFALDPSHKDALDRAEGLRYGYEEKRITLLSAGGDAIEAFTYYAAPAHINPTLQPYHWYKEHVVRGAREHGLPEDYVRFLDQVASVADPDRGRHEKEMSIYR